VYHGTKAAFDEFKTDRGAGKEFGIYVTPREKYAQQYGGGSAKAFYVNVRNPLVVENKGEISPRDLTKSDVDKLVSQGYDGIVSVNRTEKYKDEYPPTGPFKPITSADEIVAFHPNQIKSATGNAGTFSRTSNKITEAWDESKHPRDKGKFASKAGATMDAEVTQRVEREIERLSDEYGADFRSISVFHDDSEVVAHGGGIARTLGLNAKMWGDKEKFKAWSASQPDGRFVDKTARGMLAHEYGHLLAVEHIDDVPALSAAFEKWDGIGLSDYARHDSREMGAEAFVHYVNHGNLDGTGLESLAPMFARWKKR